MSRVLICALFTLAACASVPKRPALSLANCTDVGTIAYDPKNEPLTETQTPGPSQVIWVHPPEVTHGQFIELNGRVYRCLATG